MSLFNEFEELVRKLDAGNWEFFVLGDISVDLLPNTPVSNAVKLKHILDIYGLDQLITEPTRITLNSRSLIDLLYYEFTFKDCKVWRCATCN